MSAAVETGTLDPVRYEIFAHRLWAIGEEGRVALQRVSASPIVVQGGECMQSFYDAQGRMVLACSGHLRFAAATSDAIRKVVQWFGDSPGIHDGDQIFFNDPYVAGAHTYDQMVIKPLYHQGELIGWTASSSHTADTGGVLRGAATEIYHEGIRILGLKVVEGGQFRSDVCKTIVEQCRDPHYVELDLRSRIAGNNVSAKRFADLVQHFGPDFVKAACQKMIDDAEHMARTKLRRLPNGTWTSRMYSTRSRRQPYQVVCRMTKADDELFFDLTGTSPEGPDDQNATLPCSMAMLALALTNMLFWDVPWSDGKMAPVHITIPEGSILNCRFPLACGAGTGVGQVMVHAVCECVAKMLHAGGLHEDVNAGWRGPWSQGGPGFFYGGHDRAGTPVAQGIYEIHGSGFGAAPSRDGVDTAGAPNIPAGGISDVERIEMQYPFLYLTRSHNPNGAGYGRWRGGAGSRRVYLVYGSEDLSVNFHAYAGLPKGFGLFGGYPTGSGGFSAIFRTDPAEIQRRLGEGDYPVCPSEILENRWGEAFLPQGAGRVPVPEWGLIADETPGGGGFGDPLDREPAAAAHDVVNGIYTRWAAERFFGVVVDTAGQPDAIRTEELRAGLRRQRLAAAKPVDPERTGVGGGFAAGSFDVVMTPHVALDVIRSDGRLLWRCRHCGHLLGPASETYKRGTLVYVQDLDDISEFPLPSGERFIAQYLVYLCPGCGTSLQLDVHCPEVGSEGLVHDIALEL